MSGLVNLATTLGNNLTTNLSNSFSSLTAKQWIRLVIIAGTYMLLRPYLIKLGARSQMKAHEADEAEAAAPGKAQISPNEFRGQKVVIPEDSDSEEEAIAETSAADWGKKARRRQRELVKRLIAEHEKKLAEEQEDEEDKDIEEFLVKE